jgi:hypothetical protein
MHVQLLVPDLLRREFLAAAPNRLPPPALPELPALGLVLARARRRGIQQAGNAWLAGRYEVPENTLNAAASLVGDGGVPGTALWLRADPVQLTVDRDALVLADAAVFSLSADEAGRLAETINRHFGPELQFEAVTPLRWYARLGPSHADAATLAWTHLSAARGRHLRPHLPQGEGSLRWNALANEVQMLLHEHPVNAEREARGAPLVNSLWFWGAGQIDIPGTRAFASLASDDPVARGIAQASGAAAGPLPPTAAAWRASLGAANAGIGLVHVDTLSAPAAYGDGSQWLEQLALLERDWVAPLLADLREGRIGMLTLVIPAGRDAEGEPFAGLEAEIVRADLRRFWRRVKPLAHYLDGSA